MAQATKAVEGTAKGAEDAAKKADTAMGQMVKSAQNNRQAWDQVGGALTGFGAASVGALGLATKAAMDWESSWAGVQKTVDGTAPQMEALESGLRGLARELPASHAEIAAVAEAAGQLGIETPNVLGFTRTMIDMGEATNMSAEEAATSLARFMNVMGTSQSEVGRLGASVVGLGNNFATTESEIVQMSQRLSGAGAQANMTEGDVLGIAAAMSSVGIEAEAGGSAMSLTMKRIGKEVDTGGSKLELFAQVAGMSAEQFSQAWKSDPAAALDAFIAGLSTVESQGMTTNGVLAELGITGIRESDALLRLSAAAGQGAEGMSLMAEAVQMGNEEFDKGSALIEEASKRYETAESRIAIAKNALVDAGISIGGVVLPAFANLADGVADVAGWFADLPGPVHETVAALGGIAGGASLAAGSFLLIFPRVMDTVQAFKTLRTDMPGVAGGLGKVGKAAGVAAGAFIGLQALGAVVDHFAEARITAEQFTASLMNASATSEITAASINEMVAATGTGNAAVTDLGNAFEILDAGGFAKFMDQVNAGFGVWDTQTEIAIEQVNKLDQAMATLYQSGNVEQMSQAFKAAMEASGESAEGLIARLPTLKSALTDVATSMGLAADDATLAKIATGELVPPMDEATGAAGAFAEGMGDAAEATQSAADAATEALSAMRDLANEFIGAERGVLDYADAMDEAAEAAQENGKHWEDGTEAADENKRALLDLAEQAWATADALSAEGKSGTFLEQAREDLIETAVEMGMGREAAEEYVNQLLATPEDIATQVDLDTQAAREEWTALWADLGYHPPEVPVGADTSPAEDEVVLFEDGVVSSDPALAPVGADTSQAQEEVTIWGSQVGDVPATVYVQGDLYGVEATMEAFYAEMQEQDWTVEINGETATAEEALGVLLEEVNNGNGSVTINGVTFPADTSLMALIEAINMSEGEVTITGDNSPAKSETDEAKRHADGTEGTIDVDADTSDAESSTNHAARDRSSTITATAQTSSANAAINAAARTRTAYVNVVATGATSALRAGMRSAGFATGGPVYGPGTGTSDSIPALLSNGEHVITAREVALAGGQDAIYRMREAIRSGFKFANGGAVGGPVGAAQSMPYMQVRPQNVSASVDAAALTAAVRSGMQGMGVQLNLDGRTLYGAVVDAGKAQRRPFVTGRS